MSADVISRGDVWWYDDPMRGPRPHLIMTRHQAISVLTDIIGVPATRTIRGIPTEVRLDRGDGMPSECALTLDNITTVRRIYLTSFITTLGPNRMHEVCAALNVAVAC